MITWLVGNMHVGESNLAVCRNMKEHAKNWRGIDKNQRKAILREALHAHKENRKLYRDVMSGNI